MIPVMNIIHDSVVDGEGLRSVLFVGGCPHHCEGCHNKISWNVKNATLMSIEDIYTELLSNELTDITFSGGEPFLYAKQLIPLAKRLVEADKDIWAWSGWTYEELTKQKDCRELLEYVTVLVGGKFIISQRDISLYWIGSKNQEILKLEHGEIVAKCDPVSGKWSKI